ncbi:hypothetical protein BDN72DRAFT_142177 [Pluteus cervinus]|uniref:Uncharacterized protein n=1 Tax=Pluteus cervinus TaxID=181527 RepID=A0ACD2ZXA9_9AGAR|nr:hypothetical protein BDN72DRAFT_142177 [Pluteus cervinus]
MSQRSDVLNTHTLPSGLCIYLGIVYTNIEDNLRNVRFPTWTWSWSHPLRMTYFLVLVFFSCTWVGGVLRRGWGYLVLNAFCRHSYICGVCCIHYLS